jgi:HEAT repeat protein
MRAILPVFLVAVGWLYSARADEPQTLYGKTVEGWREILRDKSATAGDRRQAVWAIGCFGPEAKGAVPDLIETFRQGQSKDEAIDALVAIGAGTEVTIPVLIERFLKQGCVHRTGAGTFFYNPYVETSLAGIGAPAVPALVEVLKGPNKEMRVCAAWVLCEIGPAARTAIPSLIEAIERLDQDWGAKTFKFYVVRALGRIGPDARAAVPILNRLLDQALKPSPAEDTRDAFDVATALAEIGAPPTGKLLDAFVRTGDSFAARQLACLGPKAREAVPSLRALLTDKRLEVRANAAVALAYIEPSLGESIPVLIEGLNHLDDNTLDVLEVPQALAQLGPKAKAAIPTLIGLVKKERDDSDVLNALVQIDPEGKECVPALISALDHEDFNVVVVADDCLGLLGPKAKDSVPALAAIVTRKSDEEFSNGDGPQISAARALRRIGPQARPAIPALIGALKYRRVVRPPGDSEYYDYSAATAAAEVLGAFGAEAKAAIPALIEVIQTRAKDDENLPVRKAAILALGHMGPDATAAIPVLQNLIKDEQKDLKLRPEMLAALYQLAPDGRALAEKWLDKPPSERLGGQPDWANRQALEGRAMLLGVMGRTSIEGDSLIRRSLERLDLIYGHRDPRLGDPGLYLGNWFERLARFGVGGRLAIPRLNEFREHPSPWVRMWASEALTRITPNDHSLPIPSRPTKSAPASLPPRN